MHKSHKILYGIALFGMIGAVMGIMPTESAAEMPASGATTPVQTGTATPGRVVNQSEQNQQSNQNSSSNVQNIQRPTGNARPSVNRPSGVRPSVHPGNRASSVMHPSSPAPHSNAPAIHQRPAHAYAPKAVHPPVHAAPVATPVYPTVVVRPSIYRRNVIVTTDAAGRIATGCSDGTREGFLDETRYPDIAACSGAWNIPGIHHDEGPACGRLSGNNGANIYGTGCNVEDLCAAGWHVCHGVDDIANHSSIGCEGIMDGQPQPGFFVSRETSNGALTCTGDGYGHPGYANDLFGCGDLGCGLGAEKRCGAINRSSHDGCLGIDSSYVCQCANYGGNVKCSGDQGCNWCRPVAYFNARDNTVYPDAWKCGNAGSNEAHRVTKISPDLGGVLCCRN